MRFGTRLVMITCVVFCPIPVALWKFFASLQRIYDIKMSLAAKYRAVQTNDIFIWRNTGKIAQGANKKNYIEQK